MAINLRHKELKDAEGKPAETQAHTEAQAKVLAKSGWEAVEGDDDGWEAVEGDDDEEPAHPVTVSEPAPPPPPAPQITDPLLEED